MLHITAGKITASCYNHYSDNGRIPTEINNGEKLRSLIYSSYHTFWLKSNKMNPTYNFIFILNKMWDVHFYLFFDNIFH